MNETLRQQDNFGCATCWPLSASVAWENIRQLPTYKVLIDDPHYRIALRQCPSCKQIFATVFTETVDWIDGEDPQYWSVAPFDKEEISMLATTGGIETALEKLSAGRQSLQRDFPKGENPSIYWRKGIRIGVHD